jgi:hypothetical protein
MTPLGVGPEHCRESLEQYRQRIAGLAALLGIPQAMLPGSDALVALDELMAQLEVDALVRRGPGGAGRMTTVESELFAPAVSQAHRDLADLSRQRPSANWLPALTEIDRKLAAVEHDLDRWHRQVGID